MAAQLTNCGSDAGEPPVMLRAVQDKLGTLPKRALADTGYKSEAVFEALAGSGCDLVVAWGREVKRALNFDPDRSPHTAAMAAKLQTDEGRAAYRRRKWIAEPPNGWIKNVLGFRQFSLRGLHRVKAEWTLVCLALNLRRMAAMQPVSRGMGALQTTSRPRNPPAQGTPALGSHSPCSHAAYQPSVGSQLTPSAAQTPGAAPSPAGQPLPGGHHAVGIE